jgi:Na+/melibiose symporter-like transporter
LPERKYFPRCSRALAIERTGMTSTIIAPAQGEDLQKRPTVGWATMLLYGSGSVANAVQARGLATFLMVFYNQVMGLPAAWVGLGAGGALVLDAFLDPAVGQFSDNTRGRWGRRHPFMYSAALPVAVLFLLLWTPPSGLGQLALFGYMLACLLALRFFDTVFELPSSALAPELVEDYDRRTVLVSVRVLCSALGGLAMTVFAYQVALKPRPGGGGGILAKDGYLSWGVTGAIVIFLSITLSALATHRFIPWLRRPPAERQTLSAQLRHFRTTVTNRAFFTIVGSGALVYLVGGITGSLALYISLFFWQFSQIQLSVMAGVAVVASLLGVGLASRVSLVIGKKGAAILGYVLGAVAELTPYFGRLFGLMPHNGDPAVFYIVCTGSFITIASWSMTGVFLTAMIADVVEDNAVKTGRRSEGLLFAADSLFKKIASAGGPAMAGVILAVAHFPIGAKPGTVRPEVLRDLITLYIPTLMTIYVASITSLAFYNINRKTHADNLRVLDAMQRDGLPNQETL